MDFTKETMKAFRSDFQASVKELEAKYGMSLQLGNIRFDSGTFSSKVTGTNSNAVVNKTLSLTTTGDSYAKIYGVNFNSHFVGSSYRVAGKTLMVKDISTRKSKYPIICSCKEDGKSYKVSWTMIKESTLV